ncbi:non-ribosomal peptide synthetase [Cellvibrio japonicus]|uniref:Amino acid adenylation domain protein n=1 Tax=Cellvibrio japonicus (strain Ueda107) TaxID=498211 RepID=B3PGM0_CELJU|nr:non-ribosomal peptide synthetase [Cellvibrio japonicus]ACE85950.1 amino acid adenylation domain protein [Cellvibrio japonicus Ueda107]QEI12369.1 non-ribosomal peptide synthetase [Cellvibrio japonicus]QEI15942.1 non-ribosomal peptide synthetase [Cellvibrio japonicus]QEI19521.1 non-ribosomal peptide synthetase [Cellvibrio japonicus]
MSDSQAQALALRFIRLAPEKRSIFLKALAKEGVDFSTFPIVSSVGEAGRTQLSYAQQRMWFLWQLDPDSAAYNLPATTELNGPLDVGALTWALNSVIARHESLRTCFPLDEHGQPYQLIHSIAPIDISIENLVSLPSGVKQEEVQERIKQESLVPFDVANGPLLRVKLFVLSEQHHVLMITLHHIVADGWSINVLTDELMRFYEAYITNTVADVAPLSIQYADYALWQRSWLESGELERQLNYWRYQLDGNQAVLQLPVNNSKPIKNHFLGARHEWRLDGNLINGLRSLAKQYNASLFMVLLAAFKVLLYRYTGEQDIRIGIPVANRHRSEIENLIGCFINTQVMRATIDDRNTFSDVLQTVRVIVLDAQSNQDLPFEKLVDALQPERSLVHNPLFQVMFNHQALLTDIDKLSTSTGLRMSSYAWDKQTTEFDIKLDTWEQGEVIGSAITYNPELFDVTTIQRMAGHLQCILEAIASTPEQCVEAIPMLSEEEHACILCEWNTTEVDYGESVCIHRLFEAQVEKTPDRIALLFTGDDANAAEKVGAQTLTYAELNSQANQLAHILRKMRVGPDVLIGIAVERSVEMVIGLLGILKAGGAYVPLDPEYPKERLAYMMADSGISLLLTQTALRDILPIPDSINVLCLDNYISELRDANYRVGLNDNLPPITVPQNLAYVIYTSGSTGKPKGVGNTHLALHNRLAWMQEVYALTSADRVLQKTPFSFDVSVWEFFWPLLHGARLVVAAPGIHREPERLVKIINNTGITTVHFVPSMLQAFIGCGLVPHCRSLRRIICSGEALSAESQHQVFHTLPSVMLYNLYGPTEAAIDVTHWTCTNDGNSRVPIGRPIANLQTYIQDAQLNTVPVRVSGELYLGGIGLARGYHGRPALTAERFVPNPYDNNGGRLYRTGDVARYRPDGNIEYEGRIDYQVKIRGFRIELGEIEAQLLTITSVSEAVVIAQDVIGDGGQQLVAYVVPVNSDLVAEDADIEHQDVFKDSIKAHLQQVLPDYMVPNQYVLLNAMPLTPNGKLDRKALPLIEGDTFYREYEAPRTEMELQLAEIWQNVLGVKRVGLNDNFFALGGHSLLAAQMVSRIRQTLSTELPLRALFETNDLRSLAKRVACEAVTAITPIKPVFRGDALPLSYAQQRQWVLWQLAPESAAYHMSVALKLTGTLNLEALKKSFDLLIDRHETLRTYFVEGETGVHQVIAKELPLSLTLENLTTCNDETEEMALQRVLSIYARQPFDLMTGPLLRAWLIGLSSGESILFLVQHHISSDAWSMQVMVEELVAAYCAYCQGQSPDFSPLPIQYADYAIWQRQVMEAGEAERQLSYWKKALEGDYSVLELPTDHPRPQQPSHKGARWTKILPKSVVKAIEQQARAANVTPFMFLLASFQALLHRYTNQDDIRVGVPVANRTRLETERLIGFFVNTQILRAEITFDTKVSSLLQQVKQKVLDAQAHQDLPFEQLVDALQPERTLDHTPLFQVVFNYQEDQDSHIDQQYEQLNDLRIEKLTWDQGTAQFDLALDISLEANELAASFNYASDLFEAETIKCLATHWQRLLEGMLDDTEQRLADLPLLDECEAQHIIKAWNHTAADIRKRALTHRLFEKQVDKDPDAVALIFPEYKGKEERLQTLTYAELNTRSNRLAHKLKEMGVGPDILVGIAVERSVEMVVGVLAIMKAGGAYVPLDPAYPEERLAYMVENSCLTLLLTQSLLDDHLPIPRGIQRVYIKDDYTGYSADNISSQPHPNNLAYLIFTSGTTGLPKGVGIDQGSLACHVEVFSNRLELNARDRVLQYATLNFDTFGEQLFPALCCGAAVVLRGEELWDHDTLYKNILQQDISIVNLTPALWHQMITDYAAKGITDFGYLRQMLVGGESMPPSALAIWQQLGVSKQVTLWNFYGPTEATVTTSSFCCNRYFNSDKPELTTVPIGEPLQGRLVYIVNNSLNLVPIGAVAELVIGGELLARGYHGRPGLTAERFIPDPFDETGGGRLYRTGDLARFRPDGNIEYAGRIDHQVKIRGFRIELGEIEARLQSQVTIKDAVVLAQAGTGSQQQLVAYLVPTNTALVAGDTDVERDARNHFCAEVKAHLQNTLPDYMVPNQYLLLEALPLTPNGKLDRKGLPRVDSQAFQRAYEAPRTALEQQLAGIWQAVLGVERVGLNDNFFELGGDSIVAIQLVSRARQQGIRFVPKDVFQHQSLGGLARVAQVGDGSVQVDQRPVTGHLPLMPIQQWFFESAIPERHHWNQSVLLTPAEPLQADVLQAALAQLLIHHDALRLQFITAARTGAGWKGAFLSPHEVNNNVLWQATVSDVNELESLCSDAQRSLNLEQGTLLRAVLVELPGQQQRLLLAIHHLVVDGVSWRILLDDLQTAYRQQRAGQPITLPPKSSSLQEWSERLQHYAQGQALQQELSYWQTEWADTDGDLPRDNPNAGLQNKHAQHATTRLNKVLTAQLLKDAPSAYRTQINDLLLTALARVIARWTQQPSVLVQLEGHGREDLFEGIDLTRTVGWFTTMYPVKLSPSVSLDTSIKTIKEQLRAVPNKGLGFGVLHYLGDERVQRQLRALPVPRITFNYLGQFDGSFDTEGALFSPSGENSGPEQSPEAPLGNWLSINGQVYNGELSLDWSFSGEMYRPETIQGLADEYAHELRRVIEHCCREEHPSVTPSDFPLVRLTQGQLDALPVPAVEIDDIYPLSPMQQGMLFHSLSDPGAGHYINQMRVDIEGLDVERFCCAWQAVLDRHAVLRAGFVWEGVEQPLQVVRRKVTLPCQVHDWRGQVYDYPGIDEDGLNQLGQRLRAGFDLNRVPLMQVDLVRKSDDRYHLIYTNHHILMDGWSTSQLFGEVLQRYQGKTPASNPGHYKNYLAWLQKRDGKVAEKFWQEQLRILEEPTLLANAVSRLSSETDTNPNTLRSDYCEVLTIDETQRLSDFARNNQVTVNTVLQAAWLLLLRHYTGQDTVTFGVTVAGRPADVVGIEQQIGLFINTLPVIGHIQPTDKVSDWIRQVQLQNLALREYEYTPLYDIQRWAGQGGNALFDTIIVFENYPIADTLKKGSPSNLSFGDIHSHEQTNYGLTLVVGLSNQLSLHYHYDQHQFQHVLIQQLNQQLIGLLRTFMQGSDQAVGNLPLLSTVESHRMAREWNNTSVDYGKATCIQALFEAQVEQTPDATAIIFPGNETDKRNSAAQTLTYAALNARSNQLAHTLRGMGVGPDTLVGIALERSVEMVISLLGILKAGGAYVPFDPEYPESRLRYMMADSGISLLLTQRKLPVLLPVSNEVKVLCLDEPNDSDLLSWHPASCANLPVITRPDNLAYVIYTSGSTGNPKGAGNTHKALHNRLAWMQDAYGLTPNDSILQKTPFSFDVSVWEFFWPLLNGARLVVSSPGDHRDPERLMTLIQQTAITTLHFVPSMLQAFMQHDAAGRCNTLRHIICSGEALSPDLRDQAGHLFPFAKLHNLYGPTEAAIDVSHWTCIDAGGTNVPIGRPIANLKIFILNADLHCVPIITNGELYLGGIGLARGYHDRPGLTAERFIPDPFDETGGGRLYRTGDLARFRPDGNIEYAGRIDHQVKIRGFRIELGEIEARLQSQVTIKDAVVLAQAGTGSQQLVAYLVPTNTALVAGDTDVEQDARNHFCAEVKAHLQNTLPDYMVPNQYLLLETLPLTPNGKLDRKGLPRVDSQAFQRAYEAPRTALEQQLASIWQEVLGVERVGLNDNFFELGGSSISAVRLVSMIKTRISRHISLRTIFESAVFSDFAEQLETCASQLADDTMSDIEKMMDELVEG